LRRLVLVEVLVTSTLLVVWVVAVGTLGYVVPLLAAMIFVTAVVLVAFRIRAARLELLLRTKNPEELRRLPEFQTSEAAPRGGSALWIAGSFLPIVGGALIGAAFGEPFVGLLAGALVGAGGVTAYWHARSQRGHQG
jgi:hypothetical protein